MTKPIDITDPKVVKAYSHPLRIEILARLENREASPKQLAAELGTGVSATSYHVRQLAGLKLIRLVRRRQVRGAVEHYYTATVRPTITDSAWGELPPIVKQAWLGGKVAQIGKEVAAAAQGGGFDHHDMHFTRTSVRVSERQWTRVAEILTRALREIDEVAAEDPGEDEQETEERQATVVMMLFEAVERDARATSPTQHHGLEDAVTAGRKE